MYQVSADDLGATISVEVSPRDLEGKESGIAIASFGPVTLSPHLRCGLVGVMQEGVFTTEVRLNDEEAKTSVTINKEKLVLKTGDTVVVSTAVLSTKRLIETDEMNPKSVRFAFDTGKLSATCASRKDRELLVLAVRYFQLLLYCTTPITAQASLILSYFSESGSQFISHFDIGLELGQTRRELFLALEANDQLQAEKQQLKRQIGQMEKEMDDTLAAYRAMMEETTRGGEDEQWEKEKTRASIAELKAENEKLNEVVRKLENRISLLQETNNSYKSRLLDLQSHLEELLVTQESSLPRSYQLEAIEPIPNSPRCSKVMTSSSVKTARRTESHVSLKLENEFARLKADHKAAINQMKDRYEAKCAALRKIVEIQKQELIDAKTTVELTTKGVAVEEGSLENPFKSEIETLKAEMDDITKEKLALEAALKASKQETEKYQTEADALSAKLSRAEAQVRKAQRQMSVNTG